tara:strand:- start:1048 stop:1344 length:297 start_codon:yes stop_codon:yes gene_type:complete
VIGFIVTKIIQPKKNEKKASIKKIFMFEYPNTFNVSKSLLFLILIMNHMLEIKIIKGKSFKIIPGINMLVSIKGIKKVTFIFLKNSISSNKFKITPKQ